MINTSAAYKQQVKQSGRKFAARGNITFLTGVTVPLTSESFMHGGIRISDSTSADNEFSVGMVAINKATVTLKNYDGRWNSYDFTGAVLNLEVGLLLHDGTTEWLQKGVFTVYEPVSRGGVLVEVAAKDNMQKFDQKYDSPLAYPTTLAEILRDACTQCGVVLATQTFLNGDYTVAKRPADGATTYRDVVSYVAQLAGCWARINNAGALTLGWYDMDRFFQDSGDIISGGKFTDPEQLATQSGTSLEFDGYPTVPLRSLLQSGRTAQKVTVQGKNLFDARKCESSGAITVTTSTGYVKLQATNPVPYMAYRAVFSSMLFEVGKTYIASGSQTASGDNRIQFLIGYTKKSDGSWVGASQTVTVSDQYNYFLTFWLNNTNATLTGTYTAEFSNIQLELGSTATAYAPFIPNSPSPDYPSPITGVTKATINGVDYPMPDGCGYDGDSYDHVSRAGQAVKTRQTVDGTKSWGYPTQSNPSSAYVRFYLSASAGIPLINTKNSETVNCQCENLTPSTLSQIQGLNFERCGAYAENGYTRIDISILKSRLPGWLDSWTDTQKITAFKTWLAANPVSVLYQLATPTVITGTPQAIPTALHNTITNDGGGQMVAKYPDNVLSGGTFTDYSHDDVLSGGVFRQGLQPPAELTFLKSCTISTDDVRVTGVQIIPDDDNATTYFKGVQGYVVSVEKNPLAQDNLEQLTDNLAAKLIDFRFRPMQVSALDDPSIEAGDVAWVTDPKGHRYATIISNLSWSINSYETFSADAETPAERQQTRFSATAKAVQAAKQQAARQISTYDLMVQQLAETIALAAGTYQTVEKLDDGSQIVYLHDKPTLAESQKIWKHTANAFAVSNDGGKTWAGMTADGNLIAAVLNVIGINADWMRVGTITSPVNPNVYLNLATGALQFAGANGKGMKLSAGGNVTFDGDLSAAGGTFSGNLNAAGGTFKGALSAATGSFAGALSAATGTFSGSLNWGTNNSISSDGSKTTISATGAIDMDAKGGDIHINHAGMGGMVYMHYLDSYFIDCYSGSFSQLNGADCYTGNIPVSTPNGTRSLNFIRGVLDSVT